MVYPHMMVARVVASPLVPRGTSIAIDYYYYCYYKLLVLLLVVVVVVVVVVGIVVGIVVVSLRGTSSTTSFARPRPPSSR